MRLQQYLASGQPYPAYCQPPIFHKENIAHEQHGQGLSGVRWVGAGGGYEEVRGFCGDWVVGRGFGRGWVKLGVGWARVGCRWNGWLMQWVYKGRFRTRHARAADSSPLKTLPFQIKTNTGEDLLVGLQPLWKILKSNSVRIFAIYIQIINRYWDSWQKDYYSRPNRLQFQRYP